jgi:hypothetical protein
MEVEVERTQLTEPLMTTRQTRLGLGRARASSCGCRGSGNDERDDEQAG